MSTIHGDVSGDGPIDSTHDNADLNIDLCEHLTNMEWYCGYHLQFSIRKSTIQVSRIGQIEVRGVFKTAFNILIKDNMICWVNFTFMENDLQQMSQL